VESRNRRSGDRWRASTDQNGGSNSP